MIPPSEIPHYKEAERQIRNADKAIHPPQASPEQLAQIRVLIQDARRAIAEGKRVFEYLEQMAPLASPPGNANASETALYQSGYRAALREFRDIAQQELPNA